MICVDIDDDYNGRGLGLLRALYEYSFIKRRVVVTDNGKHIYISVRRPEDREYYRYIKLRYGDDDRRVELDYVRWGFMSVDVCFNDSEWW